MYQKIHNQGYMHITMNLNREVDLLIGFPANNIMKQFILYKLQEL